MHAGSQSRTFSIVHAKGLTENHLCTINILAAILKIYLHLDKSLQGDAQGCDTLHNHAVQSGFEYN